MMMQHFVDDAVDWSSSDQPTAEEIHLSGGLLVEDWPHARHVTHLALMLFDATQPLHKYGKRARRILARAAFLHNSGMMIDVRRHHKHSFRLIKETPLPDFNDKERHEIACIARYHRRALPSTHHEEYAVLSSSGRKRVSRLSALLRIADALDYHHDGRVLHIAQDVERCNDVVWSLRVQVRTLADLDVEMEHVQEKSDLFEKVFHHKLRIEIQN